MHRRVAVAVLLTLTGCSDASPASLQLHQQRFALDAGADGSMNTVPDAVDDAFEVGEDSDSTLDVLANDSDADGDALTVFVVTSTREGILTANPDGTFRYQPRSDFNGSDSFTYGVLDGNGGSAEATGTITVLAANDAPRFTPPTPPDGAQLDVVAGTNLEIALSAGDIDGDALTFSIDPIGASSEPMLVGDSVAWFPLIDDLGAHAFHIVVSDGAAEDTRDLTVSVKQPADQTCGQFACTGGDVCVGETCFPPCATSATCSGDDLCFDDHCAAEACSGVVCDDDKQCFSGACFRECSFDGECRPGERCWGFRCAQSSCQDVVCPVGSSCYGGSCRVDCEADSDCSDGACFEGGCALDACEGVSCPDGQVCGDGDCVPDEGVSEEPRFEESGCGVAQAGNPVWSVLLLAGLALARRWR